MMLYTLDEQHQPVSVDTDNMTAYCDWGDQFADDARRRVAETQDGDIRISTVFLAIDHGWGEGCPVLFETMVFGGVLDGEQERYHTWQEAEIGHAAMVARVTEAETEQRPAR